MRGKKLEPYLKYAQRMFGMELGVLIARRRKASPKGRQMAEAEAWLLLADVRVNVCIARAF